MNNLDKTYFYHFYVIYSKCLTFKIKSFSCKIAKRPLAKLERNSHVFKLKSS